MSFSRLPLHIIGKLSEYVDDKDAVRLAITNSKMAKLIDDGFNYSINGDTLYISNSSCDAMYVNKPIQLNVGLDFTINCN